MSQILCARYSSNLFLYVINRFNIHKNSFIFLYYWRNRDTEVAKQAYIKKVAGMFYNTGNYCSYLSLTQSVRNGGQFRGISHKYAVELMLHYSQVDYLFADSLRFYDPCCFLGRRELQSWHIQAEYLWGSKCFLKAILIDLGLFIVL